MRALIVNFPSNVAQNRSAYKSALKCLQGLMAQNTLAQTSACPLHSA